MKSTTKVAAGLVAIYSLGLLSNVLSTPGCTRKTRLDVERVIALMDKDHHPITWLTRAQVREERAPSTLLSVLDPPWLIPDSGSPGRYPWAYVVPLRWYVPFVARVGNGFATGGQAGGTRITYYFTFFAWSSKAKDVEMSAF